VCFTTYQVNQSRGQKLVFRDKHIIGLFVISVVAFASFKFFFTKFEMNVGAEALAAAFGTLFIILSTKFLMDKESESKIQTEKQRELFEKSLTKFQDSGSLMAEVLRDRQITFEELSQLLNQHASLMILGNQKAIDQSHEFIAKCREFLIEENNIDFAAADDAENISKNQSATLNSEQTKELWGIAVDFMSAAREGLDLPKTHDAELSKQKALFEEMSVPENQLMRPVRAELNSLEEWFEQKNFKNEYIAGTKTAIELLGEYSPYLTQKITKTLISFADKDRNPKPANIMYWSYITAEGRLRFSFGIGFSDHAQIDNKTEEFFKSLADKLNWDGSRATVEHKERNGRSSFFITAYLNVKEVDPADMEKLSVTLETMVNKYNR
jgi:hypothetical protein